MAQTLPELLRDLDVPSLLQGGGPPDEAVVARSLRRLFERLGATYIKLGQFIASTPTIFPAAYVREFANTLDQTERVPYPKVKEIVEADLGRPLSAVFRRFEQEPLATASIAQVHAATLATGEDVVVKVQKPGIEDVLKADLGFLYASARVLQFLAPDLGRSSLADIAGDIRESMLGELDFRQEQANLLKFREFLDANGLSGIATAPLPYPEASSARVLTMERLRGAPLVDLEGIRQYSSNPEQTLIDALNVWALSVRLNDFFHADVHSGNLLVLTDGRVGFIDFGIVGRIPPRIWGAVNDLSLAFARQDELGMARALIQMGATGAEVDEARFAEGIGQVLRRLGDLQPELRVRRSADGRAAQAQVAFDESEVTELVLELVRVAEEGGVKLPREFGLLLKQALYFDRYNRILAPDLDPLRDPRVRMSAEGGPRGGPEVIDV